MGKANKPGNNSKPNVKVSVFHVLVILLGADLILLFAPDYGILNSILVLPDIYAWSTMIGGLIILIYGFNGLYKKL
ncbi:MAG: hypothetical protein HKK66_02355 [Chlorobiaceae bacterium]|nr:hypothetical protein [Chlorobiaceae bacterium]